MPLLHAIVVGRTLVGRRVDDTIRAVDWLVSRPDVDPAAITVCGTASRSRRAVPKPVRGADPGSGLESDRRLQTADRVRLLRRGPADPLPLP
jgi:hypothetical protein